MSGTAATPPSPAPPQGAADQLSVELVESQKVRSDLLKWKVVIVAALFAAGLGLVRQDAAGPRYADLVLCAIPLVAAYVDLLCRQMSLRIVVIGHFRLGAHHRDPHHEYEVFAAEAARKGAFRLEGLAIVGSSLAFAVALLVLPPALEPPLPHENAVRWAGAAGVVLTVGIDVLYRLIKRRVCDPAPAPDAPR